MNPRTLFSLMFVLAYSLFAGFAWGNAVADAQSDALGDQIYEANLDGKPALTLGASHPQLSIDDAYRVQKRYVARRLKRDSIVGFKGGLTGPGAPQKFGLQEPVVGVLLASQKLYADNGSGKPQQLSLSDYHHMMLETEIGFVFNETIREPIADIPALKKTIRAVFPAIEVPDLGFDDRSKLRGFDVIANNVVAKKFILGEGKQASFDIDSVAVTLRCTEHIINEGHGSDAMGGQWRAALWLTNKILSMGYEIQPGQVLITGALGKMVPAQACGFEADFGSFGNIKFDVHD